MAEHSRYGGSTADRWMNCAGSSALCATVPKRASSKYADEGSAAHALAEACLKDNLHPTHFLGAPLEGHEKFEVTQEMCDAVVVYLNAVTHEQAQTKGAELYVEHRFVLDIPGVEPGTVFGTNDAMVYHPQTKRLVVFDYKHGAGVSVTAEDNSQLKFYAAGAIFGNPDWRVAELELVIVQPRARDVDELGAVRRWPTDVVELLDFLDDAGQSILLAEAAGKYFAEAGVFHPNAGLESGSWCRWCDAAAICPLRQAEVLDAAQLDFADMTEITADVLPDPKTFDVERLGKLLQAQKILNDWLNQTMELVEGLVLSGTAVPGWKAVEKIGRAKWREGDQEIVDTLAMLYDLDEDLVRPRKLATITDVEKMMKAAGATKDQIDSFKLKCTVKDSSGLTLASESDRRPAINAAERDFGDVNI